MNNTINLGFKNSNPSFGSFTSEAEKFLTSEVKLPKGISSEDVNYLRSHKAEIQLHRSYYTSRVNWRGVLGEGLVIKSPYSNDTKNLTPIKGFICLRFADVSETLEKALKEALKIAKKMDKINAKMGAKHQEFADGNFDIFGKLFPGF